MLEHDENTRSAAVALLEQGDATLSEAARLAGVSRQVVRYWAETADVDWKRAREKKLAEQWRTARKPRR
jgi:transposase-like protein